MQQKNQPPSRKKFLWWGAAALASVAAFRFIPGLKKDKKDKKETVKMLGQDGRLVEIDKKLLASSVKKVSNDELQQWIKK